mmetsp:Transcript_13952/g.48424  ORF Transcript_13952/g.48424 Transcript_13952/m.48424 type:complete len:327 (+) Transcript_13952:566-1546(+)
MGLVALWLGCGAASALQHAASPRRFASLNAEPPSAAEAAPSNRMEVANVAADRFQLVYTCNACETRNVVAVSRIAWTTGVVIAKCRGCPARHMLADNTGLCDTTGRTGFKNIVDELKKRGEEAKTLSPLDLEELKKLGVEINAGGNISLVPQDGEQVEEYHPDGRVMATSKATLKRNALIVEELSSDVSSISVVVDDSGIRPAEIGAIGAVESLEETLRAAYANENTLEEPFDIFLPPGPKPGDVLRVNYRSVAVRVVVPEGAMTGSRLFIEGAVAVRVPEGLGPGDTLNIALPDESYAAVELVEGELPGKLITVGHPVKCVRLLG